MPDQYISGIPIMIIGNRFSQKYAELKNRFTVKQIFEYTAYQKEHLKNYHRVRRNHLKNRYQKAGIDTSLFFDILLWLND